LCNQKSFEVASCKKRIHHTTYVGQKGTDKGVGLYHDVYSRLMIGIENPKLNQNKMATQSRHSFATAIKKTNSNLASNSQSYQQDYNKKCEFLVR
jgi:hypothetical protein